MHSVQSLYRDVGGAVELQPSSSHASSCETLTEGSVCVVCLCVGERVGEKVFAMVNTNSSPT